MNKKTKKILLIICIIVLIYFIGGIFYANKPKKNKVKKEVKQSLTIKGFNYILYEDDLGVYKSEFKLLKKNLENKEIDYEEYAKSISKMFIITLYSLDTKDNMYDVGGEEFIYPDYVENYKLNVQNTLYKYMKDNSDNKRNQILPTVSKVTVDSIEPTKFTFNEKTYDGYKTKLKIEYVEDLGYDKEAEIILVRDDKYLYIVEKN